MRLKNAVEPYENCLALADLNIEIFYHSNKNEVDMNEFKESHRISRK